MTFHTGQQASRCSANHEAPPAESSKRSPLSRNVGRPLTGIVLNLTLPKLHLATFKCHQQRRIEPLLAIIVTRKAKMSFNLSPNVILYPPLQNVVKGDELEFT